MREITTHRVNPANDRLDVRAVDQPDLSGACHRYEIAGYDHTANPANPDWADATTQIIFQNGPIAEAGVNGVTHEALLAILVDRLIGFQNGQYACNENGVALQHLYAAQEALQSRTKARMERGVEGTHEV